LFIPSKNGLNVANTQNYKRRGQMKKVIKTVMSVAAFALFFCAGYSQALETDFHGRLQSTTVLRDIDGFQWGFLD